MDIMDIIFKRRSIRAYTGDPVSREDMVRLLQAGMAAPSARDNKPWEFVAVQDAGTLAQLQQDLPNAQYDPPAMIIVCARPTDDTGERYWVQDCAAATQNILIAAAGLGLGAVWIGIHPKEAEITAVRATLGLPEGVRPFCGICLGHPAEEKEPRTQYEESRVHWNRY